MSNWTPFGADPETYAVLVDGVPAHMVPSLREWMRGQFRSYVRRSNGGGYYTDRVDRMRRMELEARMRTFSDVLDKNGFDSAFGAMKEDERLRAIDWLVRDNEDSENGGLEIVLKDGGSRWKVGNRQGQPGLEERVPQGVQDAADAAMATPGDAGRLLSDAWHATYGVNPHADLGYRKSIEAVEAVVLPLVTVNDATATLGKAIGKMRTDADWKLPFIKEHAQNPSQDVVLGLMQALWSGHSDRHPGTSSYVQSTQEAAEAAVSLAVTLVNLFSNGGIARRP